MRFFRKLIFSRKKGRVKVAYCNYDLKNSFELLHELEHDFALKIEILLENDKMRRT